MRKYRLTGGLLMALSLSTFLGACGDNQETSDRSALERESLERELQLALQPDSTELPTLTDLPLEMVGEQNRRSKTLRFRGDLNGINHVHVVRRSDANF